MKPKIRYVAGECPWLCEYGRFISGHATWAGAVERAREWVNTKTA